jgi:Protein of unknown function (DUF4239)
MSLAVAGLIVGVCVIVGVALHLLQRFVPHPLRQQHNDVAGFVYAVLGVLFTVMLAFVVVDEWETLDTARTNTFTEADELGALYWNARAMPADVGRDLELTTKQYAQVVIDREWAMMAQGQTSSQATDLVYTMRDEINALPTATPREQELFAQSLRHVNNLESARRRRLDDSSEALPPFLWAVLVIGSVLTVGYTFLFGLPNIWAHILIAAPLAVLVALVLIVIDQLNHPFSGMVAVGPDAYRIFLDRLPSQR